MKLDDDLSDGMLEYGTQVRIVEVVLYKNVDMFKRHCTTCRCESFEESDTVDVWFDYGGTVGKTAILTLGVGYMQELWEFDVLEYSRVNGRTEDK